MDKKDCLKGVRLCMPRHCFLICFAQHPFWSKVCPSDRLANFQAAWQTPLRARARPKHMVSQIDLAFAPGRASGRERVHSRPECVAGQVELVFAPGRASGGGRVRFRPGPVVGQVGLALA